MSERFFLDEPPTSGVATLFGDEARHLARVLRAKPGDDVRVFDGKGREWSARVTAVGRDRVSLALGEPIERSATSVLPLAVAVALPKGDRQKWMVEKLTELGVAQLVPLVTTRGVAEATPGAIERLRRGVVEACKQCGRNTLLDIAPRCTLAELLANRDPATLGLIADPSGEPLAAVLDARASDQSGATGTLLALVGPEGGFTPEERSAATAAGFVAVRLGPNILRVETAAVAIAAAVAAENPVRADEESTATFHADRMNHQE